MATVTVAIPLTVLLANQVIDIPAQAITGHFQIQVVINRNVGGAGSLDLTPLATISLHTFESSDGGATWVGPTGGGTTGGQLAGEQSSVTVQFSPGTTHVKARIINGPVPVTVSGSVILS